MNKKILIGSIIAVALLLLMPSITAIQSNKLESNNINHNQKSISPDDFGEHLLLDILCLIVTLRALRAFKIIEFAFRINLNLEIIPFIMLIRGLWLFVTTAIGWGFLFELYEYLGWDWPI